MARHFQYRVEVFFKEIILDGPFGITKYYAIRIEFKKGVTQMYILLREFSMDQIFKMKLSRLLRLLRKQQIISYTSHLKDPELFELVKTY